MGCVFGVVSKRCLAKFMDTTILSCVIF
jgi:hypothetical protein